MLLGSLCCNVFLLTTENKIAREKEKIYLFYMKKFFFTLNMYALPDADPGEFKRGYTGLGAKRSA